jgi:hypothetical protein
MKAKCVSNKCDGPTYRITPGKEYVVLGLTVSNDKASRKFWIKDDPGHYFVVMPSELFDIVDPRVSKHWVVHFSEEAVAISAREFLSPTFLDELTDFEEESVAIFKKVSRLIEDEANAECCAPPMV